MASIHDKIRALLAKAASSDHEGESALFFAKAQELMEEHQIELFELHTEDPIGITESAQYQQGPTSYKSKVQVALCGYYGARAVISGWSKKWKVLIAGPESARLTIELMTDYVWAQVCKEGNTLAKQGRYNRGEAVRHIANALCQRIYVETAAKKRQTPRDGTSFSLVVVDAVDAFLKAQFGELETTKSKGPKSLKQSAVDAAKNISLNQQVHTGAKALRLT